MDLPAEKCPYHGDPVFVDPDSILVSKKKDRLGIPNYVHYHNVGSTGLNQHLSDPDLLQRIRRWYKDRGYGIRLMARQAAGCPYYAIYIGKPLKGTKGMVW